MAVKWLLLAGAGAAAVSAISTLVTIKVKRLMYGPMPPPFPPGGRREADAETTGMIAELLRLTESMVASHRAVAEANAKLAIALDGIKTQLADNGRAIRDSSRAYDNVLREFVTRVEQSLREACRYRK